MKLSVKLSLILSCILFQINAQIAFQDDFESYSVNDNITTHGYEVLQSGSYAGTVTAAVHEESSDKFVKLIASANGQAKMQLRKTISVTENTIYSFEAFTRGQFKRRLRILNATNNNVIAETSDFDPTEDQNSEWIKQEVAFLVPNGVTSVKINIYHNWSGTLSVDNIKVEVKQPSQYYLNQDIGDDSNDGTIASPWKSLSKISETLLVPGDTVFFNKGDRFDGHFIVNGSGSLSDPIVITSYGNGNKPIITGEVGATGGGDYQEAIYVNNNDHMIFDGLEINNEST